MSAFRAHSREVSVASKTLLTNEEQESDDGRAPLDYMDWSDAVSADGLCLFADQALPGPPRRETRVETPGASSRRGRSVDRSGAPCG